MKQILDKNGVIVTRQAEAAKVFYRLINDCKCDWHMDWFNHLGTFDPQTITSKLCDEYARGHNYYGNGRNHLWELAPKVRAEICELSAPLCNPVRNVFYMLFPHMKPADFTLTTPDYLTQQVANDIKSCYEMLPQFFVEGENGSIELVEELRKDV